MIPNCHTPRLDYHTPSYWALIDHIWGGYYIIIPYRISIRSTDQRYAAVENKTMQNSPRCGVLWLSQLQRHLFSYRQHSDFSSKLQKENFLQQYLQLHRMLNIFSQEEKHVPRIIWARLEMENRREKENDDFITTLDDVNRQQLKKRNEEQMSIYSI